LVTRVFPQADGVAAPLLENVLADIQRTRRAAGVLGAVAFVWFSTRLFGTLRTALVVVFDVDRPRGVMAGKLFDAWHALAFTALALVWLALSTALVVLSPSGVAAATRLGFDPTVVDGAVALLARATAVAFLFAAFYGLFKLLPNRRVAARSAAIGAAATTVAFEAARAAFGVAVTHLRPTSVYSGTLAAIVLLVLWVYYAAIVVLAGAEVARAHELAAAPAAP
jgi:membrane protein